MIPALFGLLLGAIVGSFLATILVRWPRDESAVSGRSRCDSCGTKLGAVELVPILGFLLRAGRCRHCGSRIDRRHFWVEIASALVGTAAMLAHPWPLAFVTLILGLWLLLIALLDAEHQWLPDRLSLPLVPAGLAAALAGFGPPLGQRLAGALVGWAALFLIAFLYRRLRGREGMGGGDPKLLAGIGAWIGLLNLPFVLLGAGLLGLVAIVSMKFRGRAVDRATRLPLGTLMALSAWPIWLLAAAPSSYNEFAIFHSGPVHLFPIIRGT